MCTNPATTIDAHKIGQATLTVTNAFAMPNRNLNKSHLSGQRGEIRHRSRVGHCFAHSHKISSYRLLVIQSNVKKYRSQEAGSGTQYHPQFGRGF